jgi:hypothetical protein
MGNEIWEVGSVICEICAGNIPHVPRIGKAKGVRGMFLFEKCAISKLRLE